MPTLRMLFIYDTTTFIIHKSKNERDKPFLLKADFGDLVINVTLRIVMLIQKM